jgi:hypothetical protein
MRVVGLSLAVLGLTPAATGAAPTLAWTAPAPADGSGHPTAVSCPSEALCVAVDDAGSVLSSSNPSVAVPAWTSASIDAGHALNAVSCASGSLCVAVDGQGNALESANPTGGIAAWSSKEIDPGRELTGVACPTVSLCVVVDASGDVLVSEDPAHGAWRPASNVDGTTRLSAISCSSASSCVAVDAAGGALASSSPAAGAGAWRRRQIDFAPALSAISCVGVGCVAVDGSGNALASGDPTAAAPTWSSTEIDLGGALAGVSCAPSGLCVAVDGAGAALASENPTSVPPAWASASADPAALTTVSCSAGSFCLALDAAGRSTSARLPPPPAPVSPPPTPRPSILGAPALGSQLSCQPGLPGGVAVQLTYQWLRELEPISGATGASYAVKGIDEGHHLQCRVTASNVSGSATATSAFVTIPFQGLPRASGETLVGRARVHGERASVPIACSTKAPHGCSLLLRLTSTGARRTVTLGATRSHIARGAHRTLTVGLSASGRQLLARHRRLAVSLLVSGTVVGSIEAPLSDQRLVLVSGRSPPHHAHARGLVSSGHAHAAARRELAATPYMGWDTYFAFGARYSESTVLEQASDLISLGLARRGYRYVWLDVGWWQGARDQGGRIAIDRAQWPHGMVWLTSALHRVGLLAGLYTDAGADGCGGVGQGSFTHYRQDADTFAAWGFDAVKVDFCGGSRLRLDPAQAYREFRAALDSTPRRRPMLLSICDFLQPGERAEGEPPVSGSAFSSFSFGPEVGNSWRTDGDVGTPGRVPFGNVLRNLDADAAHPEAAGPGHWNDPDYLGPDQGMGPAQFRTQVSMWAMLASPLMVSRDLGRISRASLAAVGNREAIAIDQDPAGVQGTLVSSVGDGQVWVKPLADGSRAVALLNRGSTPLRIETSAAAVGLAQAQRYALRDVWRHTTSTTSGPIAAEVPSDATVLLRVSAGWVVHP